MCGIVGTVKTCREAKRMALMDAIASVKGRVEDVKTSIQERRTKNEEYATIVSQQRLGNHMFICICDY